MRKVLPMSEIEPMLIEAINKGEEFRLITAGTSMLPMLGDRTDTVILVKPDGPLKKYDVALYKRENGDFVLHRVVKTAKDGYGMCGDNQLDTEYPISDGQIIATVKAFVKNGKYTSVASFGYRIYCVWQCGVVRPFRRIKRLASGLLKRRRGK